MEMKIEKIILAANDKKISGLRTGTGTLPVLIVGAGSFYLNKISDQLKSNLPSLLLMNCGHLRKVNKLMLQVI